MFKFTVVNLAGTTYLTTREESLVRDQLAKRAAVMGETPFTAETIEIPASWLLMIHHGWQGGTIHQVAAATGLSTSEILDLDKVQREDSKLDGMSDFTLGFHAGHLKPAMDIVRDKNQYWRGVCEHISQYRSEHILKMYQANH